jgi:regulator of protease activity HflC (stomatin/prohibitin superfamily)
MVSDGAIAGTVIGIIVAVAVGLFLVTAMYKSVLVVREKQVIIVERLGRFSSLLTPGVHLIVWPLDRPKVVRTRVYLNDSFGATQLVEKATYRLSTQDEILDVPRQNVITKDSAAIYLDVLLNYKVVNPKAMAYSAQNLPNMMARLLQAQVRNVAGNLEVDALIEETSQMDRVAAELNAVASRWGVAVSFVKFQRVDAGPMLSDVLAKRKNADLQNQSVLIRARATRQKAVIEAEGERDRMIREAEGEAMQIRARARGEAKSVVNAAQAEADAVREIARAIGRTGENPLRYLLALKYIDTLKTIMARPNTTVRFLPVATSTAQTMAGLGVNPTYVMAGGGGGGGL